MYSVRKVKTKSGSVTVQVVQYDGYLSVIAKHIGSGRDELEVIVLRQRANLNGLKNKQPNYRYSRLKNKSYWLLKGGSALG